MIDRCVEAKKPRYDGGRQQGGKERAAGLQERPGI
jgi:hypothetical protein